jgi:hypothetical protein
MVPNATILQLYCNLCNYIATIFSNIGECSNATILQLMQLYATILQLMQLMKLMQLYCNNFICNYMQLCNYATCNLCNFMQLYCNYMQLGVAISTLCNFMMDRCGNFNFMQLNETICNCVESEMCCNYIATYATICNYMQLMQLYYNLCNYMQLMQL